MRIINHKPRIQQSFSMTYLIRHCTASLSLFRNMSITIITLLWHIMDDLVKIAFLKYFQNVGKRKFWSAQICILKKWKINDR